MTTPNIGLSGRGALPLWIVGARRRSAGRQADILAFDEEGTQSNI